MEYDENQEGVSRSFRESLKKFQRENSRNFKGEVQEEVSWGSSRRSLKEKIVIIVMCYLFIFFLKVRNKVRR